MEILSNDKVNHSMLTVCFKCPQLLTPSLEVQSNEHQTAKKVFNKLIHSEF